MCRGLGARGIARQEAAEEATLAVDSGVNAPLY